MRSRRLLLALSLASGCATAISGCAGAYVQHPLTTRLSAADPDTQMEFLHELAEQPLASNDEAFHALLLFLDGTSPSTYDQRLAALQKKGLLPADFAEAQYNAVRRGTVAVILCKSLHISGGVSMHLFGVNERYAVRELVDMELFPTSSPNQTFSGTELVGILGKAEDFQRGGGGEKTPGGIAGEAK
jgi:hypothetical protein